MKPHKRVIQIFKILLIIAVFLGLLHSVLVYTNISFTSNYAKRVLQEQITTLTQRDTRIDGDVQITLSLLPQLLVERIYIKNPEGFDDEYFITVSEASVEVSLLSLLAGNFYMQELAAKHAQIHLIQKKDGRFNWSFDHLHETQEITINKTARTENKAIEKKRISLDFFRLNDISIYYKAESSDQEIVNHLDQVVFDFKNKEEPKGEVTGTLQGYAYGISFKSDEFSKLKTERAWTLYGTGEIADKDTILELNVQLKENIISGNIDATIKEVNLGSLMEELGIIEGQNSAANEAVLRINFKGENLTALYQQAEYSLQLREGNWNLSSSKTDHAKDLLVSYLSLRTSWKMPVILHLDGKYANESVKIDFKTNRLEEFFDEMKTLDVDIKSKIAGSNITAKGTLNLPIKTKQFQLEISLKGEDLAKLNNILDSELPPFKNYSINGSFSSNEKGFSVRADDATIGDTHFKTAIVIDTSAFKPFWTINLNSRQLQIKDFDIDGFKIEKPDEKTISATQDKTRRGSKEEPGRRLKQIVRNPKMHLDLNLNVDKVMAGESTLGRSQLNLELRDCTLILQDAQIDVPGGEIKLAASFKIANKKVAGTLKLDIDKFNYGAVARYFNRVSSQGGVISTRIDLRLRGDNFARLFDHATGKLDIALWPTNTTTGIFDIWATNLFLVILPEINKKESRINCLVALMDLEDGIMKEDLFGIDTTKVWMNGNINVDFENEYVTLSLYPRAKKARLFTVQAPIRAKGKFDDIGLITNPIDLTAAYVSFITSPLHVPARWVFGDDVPEDASEICEQLYDRAYVQKLKEKRAKEEQEEIDEWLESD